MSTHQDRWHIRKIDRRTFLKVGSLGASGLVLGLSFEKPPSWNVDFSPSVFLTVKNNGDLEIISHRSEMGQGIRTGLPILIAEELDADWNRVRVVPADGDQDRYGRQNTDASYSTRVFYEPMRKIGAAARMMLIQAAASKWNVNIGECKAQNHRIVHVPTDRAFDFADLTETAATLPLPADDQIILKDKADFKFIGHTTPIVDLADMIRGTAVFGMDVMPEGMKRAVIRRSPVAGGRVKSFNADQAEAIPGVLRIFEQEAAGFPAGFQVPTGGIVVVADTTWAALQAREALEVEWDDGPNADYNSNELLDELERRAQTPGNSRRNQGQVKTALAGAEKIIEAIYRLPHLAHAAMEPPCAVAHVRDGSCEIWAPTQNPQWARNAVADALGIDVADVTLHITLLGGGFGRKSMPDFIVEAAQIAAEVEYPVQLIWTRDDDIRHDYYHACSIQHVQVGLSADNTVAAWYHRSLFPPIGGTSNANALEPGMNELDKGYVDFPFDLEHIRLETHEVRTQTRLGWYRSVSNIQHAFAIGSMTDEIAYERDMDPVENLLELVGEDRHIPLDQWVENFRNYNEPIEKFPFDTTRLKNVIRRVAENSGWGTPLGTGRGRGICAHRCSLTYVACVVEVSIDEQGNLSIPALYLAVDCGTVVNPDRVRAQCESGAIFGLSGALRSEITFENGRTQQSNFDDYHIATFKDTPHEIHVDIIESDERPTGLGEAAVPPIAPALCNAIFAATGKRIRTLPINPADLRT